MTVHSRLDVESPCVKVCVLDPDSGWCIGCGRSRGEIAGWLAMAPEQRHSLMLTLPARLQALTRDRRRKGGRRGRTGSPA